MRHLTCEMCGSTVLLEQDGVYICQACGNKYSIEPPKKTVVEGPVELSGNISIQGKVNVVDHKFESDLALAENLAKMHFELGASTTSFDTVWQSYCNLEVNGGSAQPTFWLSMARFYVNGNLKGLKDGTRFLKDRSKLIYFYELYMDNAIKFATTPQDKALYSQEKTETLIKLKVELAKYKEKSANGCYIATCVYGSYDCPEVWTLRRYRDNTLSTTWYGRAFIRSYYAISPTLVKWFGKTAWFKKLWKGKLDRMIAKLQAKGIESTPYDDKNW